MFAGDLTGFHLQPLNGIPKQKTRTFVKADLGILLIDGQGLQMKELFHARDKFRVHRPNAPRLLQVGLEFVFFRICLTAVCDTRSQ